MRLWGMFVLVAVLVACSNTAITTDEKVPAASTPLLVAQSQFPCPVTTPNRSLPPGELPDANRHGNGMLWTILWPGGEIVFKPDGPGTILADGSLGMKWLWWRGDGTVGPLSIEGRRLDSPAPPLRADVLEGYGESGFQASGLIFPTEGCWEVTGRVGGASLTFVTLVIRTA